MWDDLEKTKLKKEELQKARIKNKTQAFKVLNTKLEQLLTNAQDLLDQIYHLNEQLVKETIQPI
jgi:predicted transcriptional regulator